MKRIIYVDFENVSTQGLNGIGGLTKKDQVKLFFGPKCSRLSMYEANAIMNCEATVELIKNEQIGKNALDFIIMVHMGYDIAKKSGRAFYIISNDKGYDPAIHEMQSMTGDIIARVPSIQAVLERSDEVSGGFFGLFSKKSTQVENTTEHEVFGKKSGNRGKAKNLTQPEDGRTDHTRSGKRNGGKRGNENRGNENRGNENRSSENRGNENRGNENRGRDNRMDGNSSNGNSSRNTGNRTNREQNGANRDNPPTAKQVNQKTVQKAEKTPVVTAKSTEKAERTEKAGRTEKADRIEKADRTEKAERTEKAGRTEKAERTEKADRTEKAAKLSIETIGKEELTVTASGKNKKKHAEDNADEKKSAKKKKDKNKDKDKDKDKKQKKQKEKCLPEYDDEELDQMSVAELRKKLNGDSASKKPADDKEAACDKKEAFDKKAASDRKSSADTEAASDKKASADKKAASDSEAIQKLVQEAFEKCDNKLDFHNYLLQNLHDNDKVKEIYDREKKHYNKPLAAGSARETFAIHAGHCAETNDKEGEALILKAEERKENSNEKRNEELDEKPDEKSDEKPGEKSGGQQKEHGTRAKAEPTAEEREIIERALQECTTKAEFNNYLLRSLRDNERAATLYHAEKKRIFEVTPEERQVIDQGLNQYPNEAAFHDYLMSEIKNSERAAAIYQRERKHLPKNK